VFIDAAVDDDDDDDVDDVDVDGEDETAGEDDDEVMTPANPAVRICCGCSAPPEPINLPA
jgi:hypothetical protein